MLRTVKILAGLLMGALAVEQASAFTMWGPYESWQTDVLNYTADSLGGPKNIGEEFRLNTPVITYGFSPAFLNYFGADGVRAIDAAFKMMNSLPQVSKMSKDLSEYPTVGMVRVNQRAQALGLLDMKSIMLNLLVEHMGLCGERHVFDLYSRTPPPGAAQCEYEYTVLNWNWDPITYDPTRYVNGIQYTYQIVDDCPQPNRADAVEYPVDREGFTGTTVADIYTLLSFGSGGYFVSLSRDDVGGLRYLYRKNNFNNEALPSDAVAGSISAGSTWSAPVFGNTNGTGTGTGATTNNGTLLRGGIEKVTFVKMQADSVYGTSYRPTLINYSVPAVINSKVVDQKVTRLLTTPDILIDAADAAVTTGENSGWILQRSSGQVNSTTTTGTQTNGTQTGPGVFVPQMTVTFNKLGAYQYVEGVSTSYYLTEAESSPGWQWGSFDGSTNAPIVYPKGSSIRAMEDRVLNSPLNYGQQVLGTPITFGPNIFSSTNTTTTTGNANNNNNNGGR